MQDKRKHRRQILAITVLVLLLAGLAIIFATHGKTLVRFFREPEHLRLWVESHGLWGKLIYVACVVLQIVLAVIPGEPLELMAGYAFGAVSGTLLCLGASALGSVLVFVLVRRYGMRLVELFYPVEKLENLKFLKTSPKRSLLFALIFAIPGTPKDLLCYYAGLTDMKLLHFVLISSVGRLPSIVTSTLSGHALGTRAYVQALVIFGIVLAISGAGVLIYSWICRRNNQKS